MTTEPLFEYVGIHLTGHTVFNDPEDDDEDEPVEEPELSLS